MTIGTCQVCKKEKDRPLSVDKCYSCLKEEHIDAVKEEIANGETTSTYLEDCVFCPYCGDELNNIPMDDNHAELFMEGEYEWECGACEKVFLVEVHVTFSYSTERKD